MDATALALCRDQKLPINVFSIFKAGSLEARGDGRRTKGPLSQLGDADMNIAEIKKQATEKMSKSIETLKHDLSKVRTGRAHAGLVDHLKVDYYGTDTPIPQVANSHARRCAHDPDPAVGQEDGARRWRKAIATPISA
jgi:hypothetical protein